MLSENSSFEIDNEVIIGRSDDNINNMISILRSIREHLEDKKDRSSAWKKFKSLKKEIAVFGYPYNKLKINDERFIDNIRCISEKRSDFLYDILSYASDEIIKLLKEKKYDMAYDFIDAIHSLPTTMLYENEVDTAEWKEIYIEPVRKKYGNKYFENTEKYCCKI
ncbi:MAG: hypothetical protein IJ736_06705 [Firmicutes bacterium]|nr:hypothetical protein [Bacillota bacterium]